VAVPRRCVFCGSSGKLTNEHAWPGWITRELLRRGAVASRRWGEAGEFVGFDSPNHDVTVKRVCETCNTEWMAGLEGRIIPILLPWVRGRRARLVYEQQELIATWAVKTAMMLQYTPVYAGGAVIPASQYAGLFRRKTSPPDGVEVFIGIEPSGPPGALFGIRGLHVLVKDEASLAPRYARYLGYEVTMIARHLVLKLLGHVGGPADFSVSEGFDLPGLKPLTKIWPPEASGGVLLPPSYRPGGAGS
jgi:hypothetical protein